MRHARLTRRHLLRLAAAGAATVSSSGWIETLAQDAAVSDSPVTAGDLTRFASTFGDLADPDVMSQAWQ